VSLPVHAIFVSRVSGGFTERRRRRSEDMPWRREIPEAMSLTFVTLPFVCDDSEDGERKKTEGVGEPSGWSRAPEELLSDERLRRVGVARYDGVGVGRGRVVVVFDERVDEGLVCKDRVGVVTAMKGERSAGEPSDIFIVLCNSQACLLNESYHIM